MAEIPDYVLAAALEVFRESGYEQATVRDIAAKAGIAVSSLYTHIASKEELFLGLITPEIDAVAARVDAIVRSDLPATDKLRAAIVSATTAFDRHYPELFIYLRDFYPVLESADPERPGRYEQSWSELLQAGADSGALRGDLDPRVLTYGILGMVSWMYRWYRQGGTYSAAEIGRQLAAMVVDGLAVERVAPGA